MQEHIVAVFDSEARAEDAARDLMNIGLSESDIRRYIPEQSGGGIAESGVASSSGGGFWSWLLGEDQPATRQLGERREAAVYDRRVSAGNTVLAITVAEDSQIHRVIEVIESHDPLEIEEETEEEIGDGRRPLAGTTGLSDMPPAGIATPGTGTPLTGSQLSAGSGSLAGMEQRPVATARAVDAEGEQTLPLAEEELDVGKRTVDRGTTRVRRFVVERPVERDVTLHGERVTVERRRPVDAAVSPGSDAFEERTVEVHESEEVPVVGKTARVTEEVVIRREETERQETVRDTLRRDEVEVTPTNPASRAR